MACSYSYSNGISVRFINGRVTINGIDLPPCPSNSNCTTVINNKVFIGGYEWKGDQWKRTIRALWYWLF